MNIYADYHHADEHHHHHWCFTLPLLMLGAAADYAIVIYVSRHIRLYYVTPRLTVCASRIRFTPISSSLLPLSFWLSMPMPLHFHCVYADACLLRHRHWCYAVTTFTPTVTAKRCWALFRVITHYITLPSSIVWLFIVMVLFDGERRLMTWLRHWAAGLFTPWRYCYRYWQRRHYLLPPCWCHCRHYVSRQQLSFPLPFFYH